MQAFLLDQQTLRTADLPFHDCTNTNVSPESQSEEHLPEISGLSIEDSNEPIADPSYNEHDDTNSSKKYQDDSVFDPHFSIEMPDTRRLLLTFFAIECDRFNISMRAAAFLVTALLQDLNIFNVVDKNKIWRERKKHDGKLQKCSM